MEELEDKLRIIREQGFQIVYKTQDTKYEYAVCTPIKEITIYNHNQANTLAILKRIEEQYNFGWQL